jgi:hypothetical protein
MALMHSPVMGVLRVSDGKNDISFQDIIASFDFKPFRRENKSERLSVFPAYDAINLWHPLHGVQVVA